MIKHLIIHGQVQGVGFRYSMFYAAKDYGVTGWVRNRRDGTVEAMVEGEPAGVEDMIAWARKGPTAAQVDRVDVAEGSGTHTDFSVRETA